MPLAANVKGLLNYLQETGDKWYVRALRDGMVRSLPVVVLGSMSLLLNQFMVYWVKSSSPFLTSVKALTLDVYILSLKVLSLYIAVSVGLAVARYRKISHEISAILSLLTFLLLIGEPFKGEHGWSITLRPLSSEGILIGILSGFIAPIIYEKFGSPVKLKGVPEAVGAAIGSLLPATLIFLLAVSLRGLGIDLLRIAGYTLSFLKMTGDTLLTVVLVNLIIHLLWFFGIHGVSLVDSVMLSLWLTFLQGNAEAFARGITPPYITAHPFWQWFVWIGGSGAGLSLWLALAVARSSSLRTLFKTSAPTVIFNINEPLVYGLPVVMNPYLLLPFLVVPVVNGTIAFFALHYNLVHRVVSEPPWILPNPIGVFIATGGDWKGVILALVNLLIGTLIYIPFVQAYDRRLMESEKSGGKFNVREKEVPAKS